MESRIQSQLLTGSCVKGRRASSLQAEFLPGFSLAAFKRNKRKLELAERVETDFIQLKRRRQSSAKVRRCLKNWLMHGRDVVDLLLEQYCPFEL